MTIYTIGLPLVQMAKGFEIGQNSFLPVRGTTAVTSDVASCRA